SLRALNGHLQRLGFAPSAVEGDDFNFFNTVFTDNSPSKIAVIIPTKNLGDVLKVCIDSMAETVDRNLYDIFVIDHASDDPATQEYLASLAETHTVIPYSGPFNFSVLMNIGVA